MKSCVLLLSGGQDSTTCLFWAIDQGCERVHCLSVWYGQRHDREMEAARDVVQATRQLHPKVAITHEQVQLGNVLNGASPLINGSAVGKYDGVEALPGGVEPTFVPGRNVLFLTLAANRAAEVGATSIVTGVCEEDFGGYYDCRRVFIDSMEVALAQGFTGEDTWVQVHTPLMTLTKKQTVELAGELPGCMEVLALTHTCYEGSRPPCGKCHACHLRQRGFHLAGVPDPLNGACHV